MNKVMAAAGRREVRDIVDLMTVNDILPLGAVIWAAVSFNMKARSSSLVSGDTFSPAR